MLLGTRHEVEAFHRRRLKKLALLKELQRKQQNVKNMAFLCISGVI